MPVDIERLGSLLTRLENEAVEIDVQAQALVPEEASGGEGWKWMNASKAEKEEGRRGALRALSLAGIEARNLQDRTLERLAEKQELAGLVLAYRQKRRLLGRFKRWEPEFYESGRVYPQCQIAGTVTNRTTYRDPNVQGIRNRDTNTTLLSSMSSDGMGPSMVVEGSTNKEAFEAYIERFLAPALKRGQIVVMDNLTAHKGKRVRELIEKRGGELLYLPPYSPDFNPLEEAFSKAKRLLRVMGARTKEALVEAIGNALEAVSAKDAQGFFTHCGYRMSRG